MRTEDVSSSGAEHRTRRFLAAADWQGCVSRRSASLGWWTLQIPRGDVVVGIVDIDERCDSKVKFNVLAA
jgi:hypothetical protein